MRSVSHSPETDLEILRNRYTVTTLLALMVVNPNAAGDLTWKFVQYYDDGTKEEFTGGAVSRLPAPVVTLKAAPPKP